MGRRCTCAAGGRLVFVFKLSILGLSLKLKEEDAFGLTLANARFILFGVINSDVLAILIGLDGFIVAARTLTRLYTYPLVGHLSVSTPSAISHRRAVVFIAYTMPLAFG